MARLHFVKKARKNYRREGIKKGQPYWWYQHRQRGLPKGSRSPIIRCTMRPRRSAYQTTSEFLGALLDIEDDLAETKDFSDAAGRVESLMGDCQDKINSVESAFPNGCPTIDLLQSRLESCERIIDEINQAEEQYSNLHSDEVGDDDAQKNSFDDLLSEIDWTCE